MHMPENNKKKKIILTGATGVIGSGIIRVCNRLGWQVCAIVRPDSPNNQYIENDSVAIIPCDLQEIASLEHNAECQNADYFIHLGWAGTNRKVRDNMQIQQENIQSSLNACKVAHKLGCSAFVFAGSQAEYGRVDGCMRPDTPTKPLIEYGKAKLCAGKQTQELCKQLGIRHIYTRILSVYGPGDDLDTMVMSTIIQLLEKKSPSFTSGEQLWDYLYGDDAAKAILLLAEKGKSGQIYCIGSGEVYPLKDYIEIIGKIVDPKISLGIGKLPYADNQVMKLQADITTLQEDTGFAPEISFEEGIRRTVEWITKKSLHNT